MSKKGKKPLLFPDSEPDTVRKHLADPFAYEQRDPSYIPGYGDTVMANDIARGRLSEAEKQKAYAQIGAEPGELPFEFAWVRVSSPGGGHSYSANVDAAEYRRRGYRPITDEEFKSLTEAYGWELPPTAHVEADGSIRREDTALWVVDGDRARAYEAWLQSENRRLESAADTEGTKTQVPISVKEEERGTVQV